MRPITTAMLRRKRACEDQVRKFEELFGDSVVPTRELALKHAGDLDFRWASCLLPAHAERAYHEAIAPAEGAYDEAIAHAGKAYDEAIVSVRRAYHEAITHDERAYHEAIAHALTAYDEAAAPAQRAYHEAVALAFVEVWEKSA